MLLGEKSIRNYTIFVTGINTNLRASDILRIKIGMVRYLLPGQSVIMREKKTGKLRYMTVNGAVCGAVKLLIEELRDNDKLDDDYYLFQGDSPDVPLCVSALSRCVKKWCEIVGLRGNYGSHTLRKTWGYHQRVTFGVDIPTLMMCFNHSNQRQTLYYLGIQEEEIREVFMNEI